MLTDGQKGPYYFIFKTRHFIKGLFLIGVGEAIVPSPKLNSYIPFLDIKKALL